MSKLHLGNRKRLVIGIVALVVVGAAALWWFVIRDTSPSETPPAVQETEAPLNEAPTISNYNFPPIEKIIADAASPEEAAITLITYGQLKETVEKYDDAIKLFEAAASLENIPLTSQQTALAGIYRSAQKLGDTAKQDEVRAKMGEEAFNNYTQKNYREDQR
jgi:hypothetical protein